MNNPSFTAAYFRMAFRAVVTSAIAPLASISGDVPRRSSVDQAGSFNRPSGSLISTQPRRNSARSNPSRSAAMATTRSFFIFTMAILLLHDLSNDTLHGLGHVGLRLSG